MGVLDDIANIKTPRPIAAFLVGREQKRQRERQARQDQLNQLNTESQIRLRDAQTEAILNPAPEPDKIGFREVKDGEDFVLYRTVNGELDAEIARAPRSLVQRQETGPPGSFEGTPSQRGAKQIEINDQVGAINSFGEMAQRQLQTLNSVQGANTLTAKMANVGNRLKNEVQAFAATTGVEFESGTAAFDASRYQDAFSAAGLAGAEPRVQNGFLSMAIQRAIASGLGSGRALSDFDIKQQLITLGRNQSDPNIVALIFDDSMKNLVSNARNKAQANGLNLPQINEWDFGVNVNQASESSDQDTAPEGVDQRIWDVMTDEEKALWD